MKKARSSAGALLALVLLGATESAAQAATPSPPPPPCEDKNSHKPCGEAGADDMGIYVDGGADAGGGAGSGSNNAPTGGGSNGQPVSQSPTYVERTYTPTCSGNRPGGDDVMCMMAASICPNEEDTAFWVWTRVVTRATKAGTDWVRVTSPPYQCIGPTDPVVRVPVEVLIQGILTRGFARLPLPKAVVVVRPPGGRTLVNIDTELLTRTGTQDLPPRVILGKTVTVTAKAERYDWHLGDGTELPDAGPGTDAAPITHVYRIPAQVGPYVTVTWSGTFTIAGDPTTYSILGTATTDGPPAALDVKAAGSELVAK